MDAKIFEKDGFTIHHPPRQTMAFVFNAPHSGADYPKEFLEKAALPLHLLRQSEDYRVDDLFAAAPDCGAPLMRAAFARCFLDVNREPYELDPEMFDTALPPYINAASPRVANGIGTIAKICGGENIYRQTLLWQDGLKRIQNFYMPYHHALRGLVESTYKAFGAAVLIDCHSMPSQNADPPLPDIIIGDCHGRAAAPALHDYIYKNFTAMGYHVASNAPYAGGFITEHYGQPHKNIHALQIEINRALYMDEKNLSLSSGWKKLRYNINYFIKQMSLFDMMQIKSGGEKAAQ